MVLGSASGEEMEDEEMMGEEMMEDDFGGSGYEFALNTEKNVTVSGSPQAAGDVAEGGGY